jgi:hypothetical protein
MLGGHRPWRRRAASPGDFRAVPDHGPRVALLEHRLRHYAVLTEAGRSRVPEEAASAGLDVAAVLRRRDEITGVVTWLPSLVLR